MITHSSMIFQATFATVPRWPSGATPFSRTPRGQTARLHLTESVTSATFMATSNSTGFVPWNFAILLANPCHSRASRLKKKTRTLRTGLSKMVRDHFRKKTIKDDCCFNEFGQNDHDFFSMADLNKADQ